MELNWEKLIQERTAWVAHNFPREVAGRYGLGSMLGVIEELGELSHAHLKADQQIRGSQDEHEAAARDAVGDITVYLLGLMELWKCTPIIYASHVWSPEDALLRLTDAVGRLASYFYEHGHKLGRTAGTNIVSEAVMGLRLYCRCYQWDYEEIVQQTWDHVKQRDWIKYPDTGLPPA